MGLEDKLCVYSYLKIDLYKNIKVIIFFFKFNLVDFICKFFEIKRLLFCRKYFWKKVFIKCE